MDQSRQTATEYLSNEKLHGSIKNEMLEGFGFFMISCMKSSLSCQKLNKKNNSCWIFYSTRSKTEIARALKQLFCQVLRCCKVWIDELDTDSLYQSITEQSSLDCIRSKLKTEWFFLQSRVCTDDSPAIPTSASYFLKKGLLVITWVNNKAVLFFALHTLLSLRRVAGHFLDNTPTLIR